MLLAVLAPAAVGFTIRSIDNGTAVEIDSATGRTLSITGGEARVPIQRGTSALNLEARLSTPAGATQ